MKNHRKNGLPAAPPPPRWVKLFGIAAAIAIVVFAVLHLTGRSPHGHSGHLGAPHPERP